MRHFHFFCFRSGLKLLAFAGIRIVVDDAGDAVREVGDGRR